MAKSASKKAQRETKQPTIKRASDIKDGVDFHFIKSQFFRVIAVDGAWGGMAPSGRSLRVAIFNDRIPLPERVTYVESADGSLSQEKGRETKYGVVREVEAELVMDLDTAERLAGWLADAVALARRQIQERDDAADE